MDRFDVVIAGAGIIGISLALELRERGSSVLVLDKGEPGAESSSAAAGMLAPSDPATPPALRPLATVSARMFPEFINRIEDACGIKTDFRRNGTIVLAEQDEYPAVYLRLSNDELPRREPALDNRGRQALFKQDDSVDPRLLMRAALASARNHGIEIHGSTEVRAIHSRGNGVEVETATGVITAGAAVNCRGAWSGVPVRPRKGQMLYLEPRRNDLIRHVVHAPEVYIVPRSSGKILVGATVEDNGYDKTVVPATIQTLIDAAISYLPELGSATLAESWAGLRPGTPDDLPILGGTEDRGIFVASGHFRNGILLAPVTAMIMADLITGKQPDFALEPFSFARFSPTRA